MCSRIGRCGVWRREEERDKGRAGGKRRIWEAKRKIGGNFWRGFLGVYIFFWRGV